jgi:hypothetical protein
MSIATASICRQREEGAYGLTAVALAYPQYPRALGIHDDRGVAVALVQSKLIHHQTPDIAWLEGPYTGVQTAFVDDLDRVPVQAGESADMADMADRQHLQQRFDPRPQSLRQP